MATQTVSRSLLSKPKSLSSFIFSSSSSASAAKTLITPSTPPPSFLRRLRAPPCHSLLHPSSLSSSIKPLSTLADRSYFNDPNPNYSNRPPKETIFIDGCDFKHWLVVMEKPNEDASRDDIIDNYIKTLAKVVGSEDEARMKIYSVSTRHWYAFGALVSEEVSYKIQDIEGVRWVIPDSYVDARNKDYGGEPFINGQAVPYDPKYHEEWVRNNARANERNVRSDRPQIYNRSRTNDVRRENMSQNIPPPNQGMQKDAPNTGGMPPNNIRGMPPNNMGNMGNAPPGNSQNFQPDPNYENSPYYGATTDAQYQNNYAPNVGGGNMHDRNYQSPVYGNAQNFQPDPNYENSPYYGATPDEPDPNYENSPYYGATPDGPDPNYENSPYYGATPDAQYQNNYAPNVGGGNMPDRNY